MWGLALLIGEAAFFFAYWENSPIAIPLPVAGVTLFVSLVAAMVTMGVHIGRRVAGVRGTRLAKASSMAGRGPSGSSAWVPSSPVPAGQGQTTRRSPCSGRPGPDWSSGCSTSAGGAMWLDRTQFTLGAWFAVVSGAGAIAGLPWLYLVLSIAGGGLLVVAALVAARTRHQQP